MPLEQLWMYLFYDKNFINTVSCASCHINAFGDVANTSVALMAALDMPID
jgi:cytochrome c